MHQSKTSFSCIVTVIAVILLSALNADAYDFSIGGVYYLIDTDCPNAVSVTYGELSANSYSGNIIIPKTVSYGGVSYDVTSISPSAFYNCTNLISLNIPSSIRSIGDNAFYGCSSLSALYIESIESWCIIEGIAKNGSNPLYYAQNLYINNCLAKKIKLPEIETLPDGLLWNCKTVEEIEISHATKYINDSFQGCTNLKELYIPNSVLEVKGNAFRGCSSLSYVKIEDGEIPIMLYSYYISNFISYIFTYDGIFSDCKIKEIYIGRDIKDKGNLPISMFREFCSLLYN